ncbi:hypothetical protein PanWU01x14_345420 [Parasponia andersonii]|uniref:Uncharacterized protein n=1 Tax=Parasponia andersonii TaxID=3476 RepID=A0A2P5ACL4_PARAD|nr:hypothetical protein PanWU01x14_345420 [Parasponia andersonii]
MVLMTPFNLSLMLSIATTRSSHLMNSMKNSSTKSCHYATHHPHQVFQPLLTSHTLNAHTNGHQELVHLGLLILQHRSPLLISPTNHLVHFSANVSGAILKVMSSLSVLSSANNFLMHHHHTVLPTHHHFVHLLIGKLKLMLLPPQPHMILGYWTVVQLTMLQRIFKTFPFTNQFRNLTSILNFTIPPLSPLPSIKL